MTHTLQVLVPNSVPGYAACRGDLHGYTLCKRSWIWVEFRGNITANTREKSFFVRDVVYKKDDNFNRMLVELGLEETV